MAGTNKVLKEGQILFRAGEKSDGMYLIRRGELRVYLEQNGKEVMLATVGEGGTIGEMTLFDNQPRSASVKATKESEVTLISIEDFGKLMKQIPKWFVSLMTALSTRLRQTNERLKKLESGGGSGPAAAKSKPYQDVLRQINIIVLLWHKDGEKDGKEWTLQKGPMEKTLVELFNEDPEKIKALLEVLVKNKVLGTKQDTYKNVVFSSPNRAVLSAVATFINGWVKSSTNKPCLSADVISMLKTLERLALAAPYDTTTVGVQDLIKEGKRDGFQTSTWEKDIAQLQNAGEEVKMVKTSSGPGLKTTKKDVSQFVKHHELLAALYKANLA